MQLFNKVISASLSPNAEWEDVVCAFRMLLQPWAWKKGVNQEKVVAWFEERFPDSQAFTYNSGRSALFDILVSFGIGIGDEVILQSFTCVAVPNAVLWSGATPVYADIDSSLNIALEYIESKITKKTKAIIVQHTLGLPSDIVHIREFATKNSILLIEDCAHALGATVNENLLGTYGDAAFFSFGRDKVLSSVFGGVGIIKKKQKRSISYMTARRNELQYPPYYWIFQQLLHPIIFSVVLPLYTIGIGKLLLWVFQKLFLLSFPVYSMEKLGKRPAVFPTKYPNALAGLLLVQLEKLDRYVAHKRDIAAFYRRALENNTRVTLLKYPTGSIYLRFPILVEFSNEIIRTAKKQGIMIGNWYHNTIDPMGVDFAEIRYERGSCANAEKISSSIINLPTNISAAQAKQVVALFDPS